MVASLRRSRLLVFAGAALCAACVPELVSPTSTRIDDYIAGVTARNGQVIAVLSDSAPPSASYGPSVVLNGGGKVKHGGSAQISVAAGADFTRVYVSSPMASGRWDVALPSGVTVEDLVVGLSPKLRSGSLRVRFVLEGPSGVGGAAEEVLDVGD